MQTLSPGLVLAAYAEPFLEGRRAAVFGDSMSPFAAELLDRGARAVHVYDSDPARAALAAGQNRSKQVSVLPFDEADIAVRDGAFDIVFVEDLSSSKEPKAVLARVRRALSARGVAVIASPNSDTKLALVPRTAATQASTELSYYDLYDAVAAEFAEVRMLGQTPFVGYAIVDFAPEGEPDVSIDSGLVPGGAEEPEWFVAFASREAADAGAFSIVQLPAARVLASDGQTALAADLRAARSAESRLLERVAGLEAQAEKHRATRKPEKADPSKARAESLEREMVELRASLEAGTKVLAGERERFDEERKKRALELEASTAKVRAQDAQIQKLTPVEGADPSAEDVARLEASLLERGERIRKLEEDLREAERVGQELVREVRRTSQNGAAKPEPANDGAPLLAENARLAADLEAAQWTIQELEGRLSRAMPVPR